MDLAKIGEFQIYDVGNTGASPLTDITKKLAAGWVTVNIQTVVRKDQSPTLITRFVLGLPREKTKKGLEEAAHERKEREFWENAP